VVLNGDRSTVGRPKVVSMQSTAIDLSLLIFPWLYSVLGGRRFADDSVGYTYWPPSRAWRSAGITLVPSFGP